jgi:hypothetical protein
MFGGTKPEKKAPTPAGYEITHPFPDKKGPDRSSYDLTCFGWESKNTSPKVFNRCVKGSIKWHRIHKEAKEFVTGRKSRTRETLKLI